MVSAQDVNCRTYPRENQRNENVSHANNKEITQERSDVFSRVLRPHERNETRNVYYANRNYVSTRFVNQVLLCLGDWKLLVTSAM